MQRLDRDIVVFHPKTPTAGMGDSLVQEPMPGLPHHEIIENSRVQVLDSTPAILSMEVW